MPERKGSPCRSHFSCVIPLIVMSSFTPNHALLNPKFEGYKLEVIPQEDTVTRFGLEYRPTQMANSGRSPLSFKEVQSRITHNHLAIANDSGRCLYIDSEHRVILVDLTNVGFCDTIFCSTMSLTSCTSRTVTHHHSLSFMHFPLQLVLPQLCRSIANIHQQCFLTHRPHSSPTVKGHFTSSDFLQKELLLPLAALSFLITHKLLIWLRLHSASTLSPSHLIM